MFLHPLIRREPVSSIDWWGESQASLSMDQEGASLFHRLFRRESMSGAGRMSSREVTGVAGQVVAHYVAMTPNGRVFDSSLNRGFPYDIRVGAGQVGAHPAFSVLVL